MDENSLNDLKQFITANLLQQTSELREDMQEMRRDIKKVDVRIDGAESRLTKKIDDLSTSVAQALDTSNDETERRLTVLEAKAA